MDSTTNIAMDTGDIAASDPQLPMLVQDEVPLPPATLRGSLPGLRRPRHDEGLLLSSEGPVFSSDDAQPDVEQYERPRKKQLVARRWWESRADVQQEEVKESRGERSSKRTLTRNFDSAVFLASDDTEDSNAYIDVSPPPTPPPPRSLFGPHSRRPTRASHKHQLAAGVVQECVNSNNETVDLSAWHLGEIPDFVLQPLHLLTRVPTDQVAAPRYEPMIPSIKLLLPHNDMTELPSTLYRLANITTLSLRQNRLTSIKPALARLVRLEELNLSCNELLMVPYELLVMQRRRWASAAGPSSPSLRIIYHPNPFLQPIPSRLPPVSSPSIPSDPALLSRNPHRVSRRPLRQGSVAGFTPVAFLTPHGVAEPWSEPAPSQNLTNTISRPLAASTKSVSGPPLPTSSTPSLQTLCLLAAAAAMITVTAPMEIPAEPPLPPHLRELLIRACEAEYDGGLVCSVCHQRYVVPRTEWIEWWDVGGLVPFLRRGCSWACVRPEQEHEESNE